MDRRAVRLALGLTIAGALMLTAGVAAWLITAVGRVTSGPAARDLRLAAVVLLGGGVACGVAMGFALSAAGRARPGGPSALAGADGLTPGAPASPALAGPRSLMNPPPPSPPPLAPSRRPVPPPWLGNERPGEHQSGKHQSGEHQSGEHQSGEHWPAEQWSAEQSLGEQPAAEQAAAEELSGDPGPADRVWWRAAYSPVSGWDDTSEEWLRSLRGPASQQPPPHSAE
jgi:hypothetical protein